MNDKDGELKVVSQEIAPLIRNKMFKQILRQLPSRNGLLKEGSMGEGIEMCPTCGNNPKGDKKICPFSTEIHNTERECECCDQCRYQCSMAI